MPQLEAWVQAIILAAIAAAVGAIVTVVVKDRLKAKKRAAQATNGQSGQTQEPQLAFPKPLATESLADHEPGPLSDHPRPSRARGPKTRPPSQRFSDEATGTEPPVLDPRPIEIGEYEGLTGSDIDARFVAEYDWLDHEGGSFTVYRSES